VASLFLPGKIQLDMIHLHSILRWAIVLAGLWAVIRALKGVSGKTSFTATDNKAGLFFMITCDIQLLVGLVVYFFFSPKAQAGLANMGAAMKDSTLRFFAVEHAFMAIIAIALVHIGKSKVKKAATDAQKHKLALIFYGIALVLIFVLIPWPFRQALGGAWF
jgi:membrane protein insertase Oxa1/YidC/SpoIIIJ